MKKQVTLQTIPEYYAEIVEKLKTSRQGSCCRSGATRGEDVTGSDVNFLICSAERKDGRTTTALGLAVAAAVTRPSQRVLLVDLDHRNPALHSMLSMPGAKESAGIVDVIHDGPDIQDVAQATSLANFQVVFRGQGSLKVPEECQADAMLKMLRSVRSRYDCAFYDSPALNEHVDARLLSEVMDGVVLVVRYDRSRKDHVLAAKRQIPEKKLAGAVINGVRDPIPSFIARSL